MKPGKLILIFFVLNFLTSYAHQDFWMIKNFGNVVVRIKTGFSYEEIDKAWIIGEYANKLSNNLNYSDTIFLDLNHHYTEDCIPDYFISFDDGSIRETWSGGETLHFLKNSAVVVREVSRKFDVSATLKLIEYAILNLSSIKKSQKPLEYNKNYCQWLINSIDTSLTKQVLGKKSSAVIAKVLSGRVYRPGITRNNFHGISYYFENNKYHVFATGNKGKDSTLVTVDNIYQFNPVSPTEVIVFDSDKTFYYVQGTNNPYVSKRWTFQNNYDFYQPYQITKASSDKIIFSFWYYSPEEGGTTRRRTLTYRIKKELSRTWTQNLISRYYGKNVL